MRPFGEAQSKAMRAYAQSGQYHTIVESPARDFHPPTCIIRILLNKVTSDYTKKEGNLWLTGVS